MPVYDKPMIYYPLSTLMHAGIRDILIIFTPQDLPLFQELLGSGEQWGICLHYAAQPQPDGLAQALITGESFLKSSSCCLILGDNLFYGAGLPQFLEEITTRQEGATVLGYYVRHPEEYG